MGAVQGGHPSIPSRHPRTAGWVLISSLPPTTNPQGVCTAVVLVLLVVGAHSCHGALMYACGSTLAAPLQVGLFFCVTHKAAIIIVVIAFKSPLQHVGRCTMVRQMILGVAQTTHTHCATTASHSFLNNHQTVHTPVSLTLVMGRHSAARHHTPRRPTHHMSCVTVIARHTPTHTFACLSTKHQPHHVSNPMGG